ncbi:MULTISPECIES: adenosylcobinamide-phosphate synthase CbiB [Clostridium]|uniref:adenosylcobinamide-phosphate synthase CbiB n=1 Tax=Clostridium TaxID=1485 RepID=UPI001FAAFCF9|nr:MULTISPECIES: adenosylcobinamide-phosphate synthase CbiB [Clostridium]
MTAISKVLTGMIEGRMVGYHLAAILAGYLLDLCLGDPHSMPHPVRAIGNLIVWLEKYLRPAGKKHATERGERRAGVLFVCLVLLVTGSVAGGILWISRLGGIWIQTVVEAVMTYYLLAARSLRDESMAVCRKLEAGEIEEARYAVSMIVGRDTKPLSEAGIARAAVETVAENASDGVIAPLFYLAIGGPLLGWLYKAVNTMDSMVGYKNDRYLHFGRAAAKLDDLVNLIPSRLAALLLIVSAYLLRYDGKNAYRIWRRDRRNHKSPNSAQTESACAGALGLRLAGDAWYFGKLVPKPYIGDEIHPIEPQDIRRVNRLMYGAAGIMGIIALVVRGVILFL